MSPSELDRLMEKCVTGLQSAGCGENSGAWVSVKFFYNHTGRPHADVAEALAKLINMGRIRWMRTANDSQQLFQLSNPLDSFVKGLR